MNSSRFKENVCRICLQHKINLNWNDEILEFYGVSYKQCYYRYTKLEENDPDFYPTNLCEKCAEGLKNAHMLFEKALESFKILQDVQTSYFNIDSMCNNSLPAIKSECRDSESIKTDEKKPMQTAENPTLSTSYGNKSSISLDRSNEFKKVESNKAATIDSTHFIDIHSFESSVEIPFQEHFGELHGNEVQKPLTTKRIGRKRRKVGAILVATLEQNKSSAASSFNSKKMRKRKKCDVLSRDTLCIKSDEDCKTKYSKMNEVGLKADDSLDHLDTNSNKHSKKSRERYLLMCSYCSLKVDGAKKLEKHEATHNENRERTVTCPECGLKLYTDLSLNLHMKIHDSNRKKNHKCEFCEKAFFNKGALNVHRRIHLGLMLKCQICEKEFFRQVDLDKHLLKHSASPLEKNVGKKKYVAQCQYCNKSILTDKLKEHIAIHLNQPQVKCKICDKNFYSRTKCTNHLRRFHLKNLSEYEDFIHYYVDRNKRMSSLMIKQQLEVQPLKS